MIIKRGVLFITIALLLLFPWHVFGESAKNHKPIVSKKVALKKTPSSKIRGQKNSKKSLKAPKKRSKQKVLHKGSKQVAHENPVVPKDTPPLIKITPLDDGKFLLEPMNSSLKNLDNGAESLSLIKKPVFEEELEEGDQRDKKKNLLTNFPNLLVEISKQLLGKSYRLGGNGQGNQGIDCSGFMKKIYQSLTLSLPHSSREQAKLGSLVTTEWDLSRLRIGDLLFFKRNRGAQIGHTGMYIGDGKMIHSASRKGVVISNLKGSDYYNRNFVMAKRLFIIDNPDVDEFKEFKENKESPNLLVN
ncbi:MAG: C40 family peptidase [Deltaproteobacteria bacterium]|nr:C40 family peptidase [Deltaproteobacteria bacterium]